MESTDKIKALTTEQLKAVKKSLEKILKEGTYRSEPVNYRVALGLVIMELEYRKRLT